MAVQIIICINVIINGGGANITNGGGGGANKKCHGGGANNNCLAPQWKHNAIRLRTKLPSRTSRTYTR